MNTSELRVEIYRTEIGEDDQQVVLASGSVTVPAYPDAPVAVRWDDEWTNGWRDVVVLDGATYIDRGVTRSDDPVGFSMAEDEDHAQEMLAIVLAGMSDEVVVGDRVFAPVPAPHIAVLRSGPRLIGQLIVGSDLPSALAVFGVDESEQAVAWMDELTEALGAETKMAPAQLDAEGVQVVDASLLTGVVATRAEPVSVVAGRHRYGRAVVRIAAALRAGDADAEAHAVAEAMSARAMLQAVGASVVQPQ